MEFSEIITRARETAPGYREEVMKLREIVLANTVMCAEIPSPTFGEEELGQFLTDRFTEGGLQHSASDEMDNVTALLPGKTGGKTIVAMAHLDTLWDATTDHTVSVSEESLSGAGLADNSLGVAVLASLPLIFERLGIELESDLLLFGGARSLGRGNLEGVRFFLDNAKLDMDAVISIEGAQLGRLSYTCLGMMRAEISISVPEEDDWKDYGESGAIIVLNRIEDRILGIRCPTEPLVDIILGSVRAGNSFNVPPQEARLRFEVRSEDAEEVARVQREVEEIIEEVNAREDGLVSMDVIAHRQPGDMGFGHPLNRAAREIMDSLEVKPQYVPSMSELSALLDKNIPALTVGLTRSDNTHTTEESIQIAPLFTGLAQLASILEVTDQLITHDQLQRNH